MKFSVLMSVYKNDSANYLKLALESIFEKQTRKPDEIVIVFDGPLTNDLYAVINTFASNKADIVKLIRLEKNCGLGNALRVGSEQCTYDYIMRMDSDDISAAHRFEMQMKYVEEHLQLDCIGTYIAEFNKTPDEDMRVRIVPETHEGIVKMSKMRNPMNHVSVCIKKAALLKCGGYKTLLLLEDYYLWLRMIVTGCKLANIPDALVYVRVGNGFNSKRSSKERITGWVFLQEYMLKNGLISKIQVQKNMLYIRSFVNMPGWLKKIIYNYFLRTNNRR